MNGGEMITEINKEDIINYYKILRHEKETELRAINLKKEIKTFHFSREEDLLNLCEKLNGEYNLYLGINERKNGGTKGEDVIKVKIIPVDIDCRTKPASDEDLIESMKVCTQILEDCKSNGFNQPPVIFSGNGYQILFCIPEIKITEENREEVGNQIQEFEHILIKKYSNEKILLDNVGDLPRIMRIGGTYNLKSKTLSRLINPNFEEDEKLREHILKLNPIKQKVEVGENKELSEELNKKIIENKEIQDLFNGNIPPEKHSRSEAELSLICKLVQIGLNKSQIFEMMASCKLGKWQEANIKYRELTYKKAIEIISKEKKTNHQKKDEEHDVEDFLIIEYNSKGKEISRKINIEEVANYLIQKYSFKTIYGDRGETCFVFDGKIYSKDSRGLIKSKCEEILNKYLKINPVNEIYEKIKRKTEVPKEEFENTDINLLPLENGIYNIITKELQPYRQEDKFTFFSPVKFDKNATCQKWINFINEALYPEDVLVAQEWFGFNLYREYFIKKGIICVGEQDTGKSVFLDTLIQIVGEKNKTGLSLQKITSGSDFTKYSMKNKLANVFDDLSSDDLSNGGAFKVATGGGYISAEEKFGDCIQFRSFAKQTFATNKIPPVKDNDDVAYFGRWIIFKFDNPPEVKDPHLRRKLWIQEELSGILNWSLEGLHRILEKGEFSYNKSQKEIKQIMEMSGSPLVAFANDVLERDDGSFLTKEELFKVYSLWCISNGKPRFSKEQIGRRLTKYCDFIMPSSHKERIWKNVKIRQHWIEKMNLMPNTYNTYTF